MVNLTELQEADLNMIIDKAFRVKCQKKLPGDCLVVFNSRPVKDRVLQMYYQRQLQIDNQKIIILKEIPMRLFFRKNLTTNF